MKKNGATAGVSSGLRMEAVKLNLTGTSGGIQYSAHVQNKGWTEWVKNGKVAGTEGKSLRLEALKVKLTGAAASAYDVWYRSYVQQYGWLGWAKNGAASGTEGYGMAINAIQVKLVKKGAAKPSPTANAFLKDYYNLPVLEYDRNNTKNVYVGALKGIMSRAGGTAKYSYKTNYSASRDENKYSYTGTGIFSGIMLGYNDGRYAIEGSVHQIFRTEIANTSPRFRLYGITPGVTKLTAAVASLKKLGFKSRNVGSYTVMYSSKTVGSVGVWTEIALMKNNEVVTGFNYIEVDEDDFSAAWPWQVASSPKTY